MHEFVGRSVDNDLLNDVCHRLAEIFPTDPIDVSAPGGGTILAHVEVNGIMYEGSLKPGDVVSVPKEVVEAPVEGVVAEHGAAQPEGESSDE